MGARQDLRRVVELLVDEPGSVEIDEVVASGERILELRVADDDLGKVIGRQGRTARALRRFLEARGRDEAVWDLKILD